MLRSCVAFWRDAPLTISECEREKQENKQTNKTCFALWKSPRTFMHRFQHDQRPQKWKFPEDGLWNRSRLQVVYGLNERIHVQALLSYIPINTWLRVPPLHKEGKLGSTMSHEAPPSISPGFRVNRLIPNTHTAKRGTTNMKETLRFWF